MVFFQFVAEVNEAIRNGKVPLKSKTPELIPRIACTLHVFDHDMEQLLVGAPSSQPDTIISKTTLENAASFVNPLETQKEILCQVINRKHENFHFSLITFTVHTSANLVGSLSAFYSPIEKDRAHEALCTMAYSNIRKPFT